LLARFGLDTEGFAITYLPQDTAGRTDMNKHILPAGGVRTD